MNKPSKTKRSISQNICHCLYIAAMLSVAGLLISANKANAAETTAPNQVVITATDKMLTALRSERDIINDNPKHVYALANSIVLPHFDFQRMSAFVLGKHWRRASVEEKARFPEQFRNLILRTYATALSEYTDETVSYLPLRASNDADDVVVKTVIERNSGPSIPVAYRMHKKDDEWKIYDITIDGISLVNNYRRSFSSEIRRRGLTALINKLAVRNNQMASNSAH